MTQSQSHKRNTRDLLARVLLTKQTKVIRLKVNQLLTNELKLIARGYSDEAIEKAKVIAKGNGTNLLEALKDDMFIAYQTKLKEDQKKEDARLGASTGSGESQETSEIRPDMTREEHEKAFKKFMGI